MVGALLLLLVVVWLDVATHVWKDLTVLAGVISGLVTFALTVLVIERVLAQSAHRRWAPVTRVALGDLLKTLAEESSELVHGEVKPRRLPPLPAEGAADAELSAAVVRIGREVARERELLARALASWSAYLSATAEVTDTLADVAELVDRLDVIHATCVDLLGRTGPQPGALGRRRGVATKGATIGALTARLAAEREAYDEIVSSLLHRLVHDLSETFPPQLAREERAGRAAITQAGAVASS